MAIFDRKVRITSRSRVSCLPGGSRFFSYSFSSLVFSLTTAVASGGHQVSGETSVEARGYP